MVKNAFISMSDPGTTEIHLYLSPIASYHPSEDKFSYENQKFFDAIEPWHLPLNYWRKLFNTACENYKILRK